MRWSLFVCQSVCSSITQQILIPISMKVCTKIIYIRRSDMDIFPFLYTFIIKDGGPFMMFCTCKIGTFYSWNINTLVCLISMATGPFSTGCFRCSLDNLIPIVTIISTTIKGTFVMQCFRSSVRGGRTMRPHVKLGEVGARSVQGVTPNSKWTNFIK